MAYCTESCRFNQYGKCTRNDVCPYELETITLEWKEKTHRTFAPYESPVRAYSPFFSYKGEKQ